MTVTDRNIIDITYVENNKVFLCVSDHLKWDESVIRAHWEILQDKLKDYFGFVRSGQFREKHIDESLQPCIKIYFSHSWPDLVEKYLNKMKLIYLEYGCDLIWIYDPQDTNNKKSDLQESHP